MNKAIKGALVTGLMVLGLVSMYSTPASADPVSPDVKSIYEKNCKKCHGWDGKGETAQGKKLKVADFTSADFQKISDADIKTAISDGKTDPKDPKRKMDAYKDKVGAHLDDMVKVVRAFGKAPGPFPDMK